MTAPANIFDRLLADARRELDANFAVHVNPQFARMLRLTGFERGFVRGEGALLFDADGAEHIDCIGGFAVHAIGRGHPAMIDALTEALRSGMPNWIQFERNPLAALLAKRLADRMPGELKHAVFSNSGSEAVECALKLARRATGRSAVLHCDRAFHGLTIGALAANGNEHLREGFGPLGESHSVAFNDLDSLERALAERRFAAFLVEPVQGKTCLAAGDGYLAEATRLCAAHGTLLVVDEIQTGIGRTGRFLGLDHDPGCRPDIVVLSKALSGGYVPIGVTLVRRDIWSATFDSMSRALVHHSTFQAGVLAMVAALTTLEIHDREALSRRASEMGAILLAGLERCARRHGVAGEVRGRGLMLGLALRKSATERWLARVPLVGALTGLAFGQAFVMEMLAEHRVLCQVTDSRSNVLKFTPPLVLSESHCRRVVEAIERTCERLDGGATASVSGTMRVLGHMSGA